MADYKGTIIPTKRIFEKEMFRIYSCKTADPLDFDEMDIITISGSMPDLLLGVEYDVETYMVNKAKYGKEFKIKSIVPNKNAINDESVYVQYLYTCTSESRAEAILKVYPNFVNMIINNKVDEIDVRKIYGVGLTTLHAIKDSILSKVRIMEVIEEYTKYGINFRIASVLFELCSNNIDLLRERMEIDPYVLLCSVNAVGFIKADEIVLKFKPDLIDSKFRLIQAFKFILEENEGNGNSHITFAKLYNRATELCPEAKKHTKDIINNHYEFKQDPNTKTISFARTYNKEKFIAQKLIEINKSTINWGIIEPDYEKFRKVGKFDMTDEQIEVLPSLFNNNCVLLLGNAGTGKSSSTVGLLNFLDSIHKSYTLVCPTGAASEVLSKVTNGRDTSTISKLTYASLTSIRAGDGEIPIMTDVLLVDESSMVNIDLMYELLGLVKENTKVVFVGDPQQLPPIGAGLCFDNLIESKIFTTCKLTHVFRYSEGGLATFIENIRLGNKVFDKEEMERATQYGNQKDLAVIKSKSQRELLSDVINVYLSAIENGRDIMDVIIATPQNVGNVGTIAINKLIQDKLSSGQPFVTVGTTDFKLGDKVYQNKNCYMKEMVGGGTANIFNSNQGIICDIYPKDKMIVVDFKGKQFAYSDETLLELNLAYAVSVHKLQGSGYPVVLAVGSSSHTFMLNRNLIYTQLTRASEKVYYFIDKTKTINRAVKKYENVIRNTNLIMFLNEYNNLN